MTTSAQIKQLIDFLETTSGVCPTVLPVSINTYEELLKENFPNKISLKYFKFFNVFIVPISGEVLNREIHK